MRPVPRASASRLIIACLCSVVLAAAAAVPAFAQPYPGEGEWGDAPEGQLAYPSSGVAGQFPTCFAGPSGFVWHGPVAVPDLYLGNSVDFELDGNAGFCPPPPYEMDESWGAADGDGGLRIPTVFTIDPGNQVVPNTGPLHPTSLGSTCQVINLNGPSAPLVIDLHNTTGIPCYLNIVFDWDQNGRWGDVVQCPTGGQFHEHAIRNLPVPQVYVGPLSGLSPGQIQIGPNSGYVWMRVTISPDPVMPAFFWDGSGYFDIGETEDYLLRIDDGTVGELGDAPEDVLAYPSGVVGQFPTCRLGGPAGYVYHAPTNQSRFGPAVDFEGEGNQNQCPQPPYDHDECFKDQDAGLLFPRAYSLDAVGTVTRCIDAGPLSYWVECSRVTWGVDVDILVSNNSSQDQLVNVLVDWDEDGRWGGTVTCPGGQTGDEHVLVDFPVPAGFTGPLSLLGPPSFLAARAEGFSWCRFTVSDAPVGAGWDGSGTFHDGETEDYLLAVWSSATDAPAPETPRSERRGDLRIESVQPNPFNPRTSIAFSMPSAGTATLTVHDTAGRAVRRLLHEALAQGSHVVEWDGRDDLGRAVASGVYVARLVSGGQAQQAKLVLLK